MITYIVSDILKSPAKVLVNTVNTVGVMGKGIAKDFKNIYPEMFHEYQVLCEKGTLDIGKLWIYKTQNKWILNFPTKKHWRNPSKPEYIEAGLQKFAKTYAEKGITSISFPMVGCGNGELDWDTQVRPFMEYYLNPLPIDIYVHLYEKDPFDTEHRNIKDIKKWLRSEPRSLAFVEVWDDLQELLETINEFVTIDGNKEFSAEILNYNSNDRGIKILFKDTVYQIFEEELLDLWQYIRDTGFCISSSMPGSLDRYGSFIMVIIIYRRLYVSNCF